MQYKVVSEREQCKLSSEIESSVADGWTLYGNLNVTLVSGIGASGYSYQPASYNYQPASYILYSQALYKD